MHVTVIAKAPVAGRVKTRLCPPCTPQQAAELAAAALRDTLDAVRQATASLDIHRVLLIDGATPAWVADDYEIVQQCNGSLAERLSHGFEVLGPGLILGMETPHAATELLGAISALERGEDVIGPALDGGYWAIGLSRTSRAVFNDIEMSTAHTYRDQITRLDELARHVTIIHGARDIDTFDDVRALAATNAWGRAVQCARMLVDTIDHGTTTKTAADTPVHLGNITRAEARTM